MIKIKDILVIKEAVKDLNNGKVFMNKENMELGITFGTA